MSTENIHRVLFLGNSHLTVFGFRKEIIDEFIKKGYEVYVSFPNGPFGEGESSAKEHGCVFIETHIDRRGKNPFKDLSLLREYRELIKKVKPDMVFSFTVKPNIYAGLACKRLKVPIVLNITGLGKGLVEGGLTSKITILMYKSVSKKARCVFFQNTSDKKFFDDKNIRYNKGIILPGSGVNLSEFHVMPYPNDDIIKFIFIGRVMKAKGIEEFLEAAHVIKQEYPNTEFHICGFSEEDYKSEIERRNACGEIIDHGFVKDVKPFVEQCHCVVLPSFHPEGVSNVLLEAAACGRPIITTDHPGCRETVDNEINGFLVKEKDANDLIDKMKKFLLLTNNERENMGLYGRKKVKNEFDRNIIVRAYEKEMEELQ